MASPPSSSSSSSRVRASSPGDGAMQSSKLHYRSVSVSFAEQTNTDSESQSADSTPPAPSVSDENRPAPRPPPSGALDDCEWYWGDIGRDEVNRIMQHHPDGTFLVRNSSSGGRATGEPYTLTVRKDGSQKLIRIYESDAKFGFSPPLRFSSVVDLILHHMDVSLVLYNRSLDICLRHPMSRHSEFDHESVERSLEQLRHINYDYILHSELYERAYDEFETLKQEAQLKRHALDAFDLTIKMFKDQLGMQHQMMERKVAHQEEHADLKRNEEAILAKIADMQDSRLRLELNIEEQLAKRRVCEKQINSLLPKVLRLEKRRENVQTSLGRRNVSQGDIGDALHSSAKKASEEILARRDGGGDGGDVAGNESSASTVIGRIGATELDEQTDTSLRIQSRANSEYSSTPAMSPSPETIEEESAEHIDSSSQPSSSGHMAEDLWYVGDMSRDEACAILANRPNGTFLIRQRHFNPLDGSHALSIVCQGVIHHAIIYEKCVGGAQKRYGFAHDSDEYNFASLAELVLYYTDHSLEKHNKSMKVLLTQPVRCSSTGASDSTT